MQWFYPLLSCANVHYRALSCIIVRYRAVTCVHPFPTYYLCNVITNH